MRLALAVHDTRSLRAVAVCLLLALGCSGGGNGGPGGAGGTTGQGQAGTGGPGGAANAGAGSSGTGGAAGGTGSGGTSAGSAGAGGAVAGAAGQAGAGTGSAGRGGATGSAGRGGAGGAAGGTTGTAGAAGGRGGNAGTSAGGGAGGAVATPVTPTQNGTKYRFAWGDVIFEIDASVGARVSTLSLGGTDIIMPAATDPTTWGSVFWTSPRSAWTPMTWPPPTAIDSATYTGSISGTHALFTGPTDTSIGVGMSKDYSADSSGWIKIAYTINATKAIMAAPWEVSRVPRGGIAFFPVGSSVTKGPLTITQSGTPPIVWFDDASKSATSPNGDKLYADGSGGWTAYVLNGNLFIKKYTDQPASAEAPMEGEVDVYPGNGFLEFEVEGPYTQIAASGHLPWSIAWRVVKVPSSVTVAAGSTSLVDFVMQQLAQ
jgi:hypothetical protein